MDLRPQAHEIIRTWLFSSVVRAYYEFGRLPWHTAVLSGWILDPDRKKMSKSKGNVVTPMGLLEQHGSDAVRYWAAMGRPGTDLAFDEGQMRIGRRLATKLLNASRFVLSLQRPEERSVDQPDAGIDNPLDTSMLAELSTVVNAATAGFEVYDYTSALTEVERFFWAFCDDYIELVKERAYGAAGQSARAALLRALQTQLTLFAPFLPYVTEEIWSWSSDTSVHRAPWPDAGELAASRGDRRILTLTSGALRQIRRAKSAQRMSMKADVALADVAGPAGDLALIARAEGDLRSAGRIAKLTWRPDDSTPHASDASPAENRISVSCTF
jgi:valyl-tRNA synthetase